MKAVCVLESILRKKDEAIFSTIASYFSENIDVIIKCSESPQSSLREKANKVPIVLISLLLLDLLWLESLFNTFFRVHSVVKYSRILLSNIISAGSLWVFGMLITLDVPC